ncbi:ParB/RepB/Spo0J family partition protein [Chlorogloeopsis sp. ULAP01]|uniref:ParB/RepB/Spo0J family partition protein n=1 Tax=Chlorogloeopsis sp. ULAP01 TaxID=3056483 RepID=UPI0025AB49C4|nr:ParB/RepB/Spo0J family partition protein [Chlorogloeopsis sp. ULAP01]MDM9381270.1 ParB/RepB/Spo0J family partition protein [Chlorogloeopsis sp. ULAP01]
MIYQHKTLEIKPYITRWSNQTLSNTIQATTVVAIEKIFLPPAQIRHYFEPNKMQELVESVRQHGILEPLLVRSIHNEMYELVSGERRYRAAKELQITQIPVIVRQLNDEEALQISLIENLQREDLNPVEETEGILQLLAMKLNLEIQSIPKLLYRMQHEAKHKNTQNVLGSEQGQTVIEVFRGLGLMSWESFVSSRLPLLNLPEEILLALRQGKIAYTKAQVIARVKDREQREALLEEVIAKTLSLSQIKERITSLATTSTNGDRQSSLKNRMNAIVRLLDKSQIWDHPTKRESLERLMEQLKALVLEE